MTPSLLVTGARLLTVAADAEDLGYRERGWMLVREGLIAALGDGEPPAETVAAVGAEGGEVLDVDGAFVAPEIGRAHV